MELSARLLVEGDEDRVDSFLEPHTPFAFFIRSNLKKGGLHYEGKASQADFFGVFDANNLVGVLTHNWMGSVQIFAPDLATVPVLADVWRRYRVQNPREIDCFLGPREHVQALLSACGVEDSALHGGGEKEGLFSLALADLMLPPVLKKPDISVLRARKEDADLLTAWRHDFNVEANGAHPGQETFDKAKREISRRIEEKDLFVLEDKGEIVSFCGIGGFLRDWTHVGPVWTPPEKRGFGYAQGVVAGALLLLREQGLTNAVLFAYRPDAVRVYRALGFDKIGNWRFDFFIKPVLTL